MSSLMQRKGSQCLHKPGFEAPGSRDPEGLRLSLGLFHGEAHSDGGKPYVDSKSVGSPQVE